MGYHLMIDNSFHKAYEIYLIKGLHISKKLPIFLSFIYGYYSSYIIFGRILTYLQKHHENRRAPNYQNLLYTTAHAPP